METDLRHECKAANFAKHVRRDVDRAEKLYRSALQINTKHPDALGNLAILLHGKGPAHYDEAEEHYVRAVKSDPKHANNLGNYGLFLADARGDAEKAEVYCKMLLPLAFTHTFTHDFEDRKTLEVCPTHANTLHNLGVLFDTVRKDQEGAEGFYRRAIEAKPKHSYALYNLAILLHHWAGGTKERVCEAETFYERALAANPRDPLCLSDFGTYLCEIRIRKMKEGGAVEKYVLSPSSIAVNH